MLFFYLFFATKSAFDLPLLNVDTYGIPGLYFDSWAYQFKNCSRIVTGSQCICEKYINYHDKLCVENVSSLNETIFNNYIIIEKDSINIAKNLFQIPNEIHYYDVIDHKNGNKQHVSKDVNDWIKSSIYNNSLFCNFDSTNQTTCNFLVNMCASSMYNPNFEACAALEQIFSDSDRNLNGYYDWPIDQPFFDYKDSLNNVMREQYVQSSFKRGDVITFQLGQYSRDGEFKGFKELKADLYKCSITKNRNQIWRRFGWNLYSDCQINFSIAYDTTDFFDIFFQETYDGNDTIINKSFPILRPIPILLKNYRDKSGNDINRKDDISQYKLFRRFFLFDNYTSYGNTESVMQFLSDITIVLTVRKADKTGIQTPYIILEYTQVFNNSDFLPKFSFNVEYSMDMSSFWNAAMYVFIIFMICVFAIWAAHSFIYYRQYGRNGTTVHMIISYITNFLLLGGFALFLICFIFGIFILIFYKWAKSSVMLLPNEGVFSIFILIIWISFGFLAVGVVLKIYLQTDLYFFLVDWENPHKKNMSVSGWRRVLIGNEWCKVSNVYSYNISFTLISILFITKGFNTILLASPTPSPKLIDIGCTFRILRFSYISFLWLVLMLLQYILFNFVYWKIVGNPFINFLEVCRSAKISCFLLTTENHGFYLHGKKSSLHADVDIETLNEDINMVEEDEEASIGKVFEIYLTKNLSRLIQDKYYSLEIGQERKEKVPAPYENYNSMNSFFRQFIEQKDTTNRYYTKDWQRIQYFDLGPEIIDDESIFTKVPDQHFKHTMIYGIQGTLMIFYLVLFTCIDSVAYSPEIGAFVVFIIDWIIYYVFKFRSRHNLSTKGILDSRFLIM